MGFWGILGPPYCDIGATIRIGREMLFLLYAVFFPCCCPIVQCRFFTIPKLRHCMPFFKALALRANAFYNSICPSVCPCVRVFTFEVPFKCLFAPLPEVGCPILLELRNPWGGKMERKGLRFEQFLFFLADFA